MTVASISVLFTNIRSVLNKYNSLSSAIDTCSAKIIALTETWLCGQVCDSEIFLNAHRFSLFRRDRGTQRGGGVLLAISSDISSSSVHVHTNLEMIWAVVTLSHQNVVIGVCYRPPSPSPTFSSELQDAINVVSTRFPTSPLLLLGDFNFPNITWNSHSPLIFPLSSQAREFLDVCSVFSLQQMCTQATRIVAHAANTLDLILTNSSDIISPITYLPGLSDHLLLHFSINLAHPKTKKKKKIIRDYNRGDFEAINNDLSTFTDLFLDGFDDRSVQTNWNMFSDKIIQLTEQYIPHRSVTNNSNAPWYNSHIRRLSNRKKRFFRAAKLSPSNERWALYATASTLYIQALRDAKKHFHSHVLPSMLTTNVKKFWRTFNPSTDDAITLTDSSGDPISSDICASVFNRTFAENFSAHSAVNNPTTNSHTFESMPPILISTLGVLELIGGLSLHSAPGCDNISNKFLKNTSAYAALILTKLFQQSLDQSILPNEWKIGKVIPIHKSGSKTSPLNYRPISLTSTCCKMFEHIIFTNLVGFLESNSFFCSAQHGFRKHYSCETQLITFTHALHQVLDRSSTIDCIFLDFSKAFDKVCHKLLLLKLNTLNIGINLLKWIECFLLNRSQFVSFNGFNSEFTDVYSGVPQGSVLGPLLFLIYINDLPSVVNSNILLFADDCVVFREITNSNDVASLQSDLGAIADWCSEWLMQLNINKCKVMRVSRKSSRPPPYHIDNIHLESVTSYKYLGVYITANLNWSAHIEHLINKANRMLGYLRRNFYHVPSSLKLLLYKTLIRSKLEYATSVWDPTHINLITALEMVQNNSVRFIRANYSRTASITSMKSDLSLPSLSLRRKVSRIALFHKMYHHPDLRDRLIPQPSYVSHRTDHRHKVGFASCNTEYFYQSFLPRTSRDWNGLPADIVNINNCKHFRNSVANIVYSGSF